MSSPWQITERRLLELLADREAFGLEREEQQALRQLLHTVPDFDAECMERAAATVQLASASYEPMPAALRARIRISGLRYVSALSAERNPGPGLS